MPEPEAAALGVTEGAGLSVRLPLKEAEPELDADAPGVREAVGLTLRVVLPLTVEEGVGGGAPVPLPAAVGVGVFPCTWRSRCGFR